MSIIEIINNTYQNLKLDIIYNRQIIKAQQLETLHIKNQNLYDSTQSLYKKLYYIK